MPSKKRKRRKQAKKRKISLLYKFVECVNCKNRYLEGIRGIVIEETKNTLKILCVDGKVRTIIKNQCWYYVKQDNKLFLVPPSRLR